MENRNWKEIKLGDYLDSISKTFKFTDKEVVFLNTSDVLEGKVLNKEYESPIGLPGQAKKSIQKGDLLFSEIRPTNKRYARIDFDSEDYVVSTKLMVLRVKGDLDPIFLELYLTSEEILDYLQMIAEDRSGTFPQITFDIISKLELKLPPLPEQKAIASVLSSLDDKIDLLHQQNQILEALAETLFRQWFVEEAKEDWEECTVGDLSIHSKISVHPKKNLDTLYHHYSIPSFDANKKPIVELGIDIQSNKYKVESNSILFSKLNPHKDKRLWLILDALQDNSICSTEFQVVKPKDDIYLYFLYGWLTHSAYYNEIASGVGGTSGSHQRIEPKSIFTAPCIKMDKKIIVDYNVQVDPLFKKQIENQQQIQTLTKLRDTLLPKLMSGEVRVKIDSN